MMYDNGTIVIDDGSIINYNFRIMVSKIHLFQNKNSIFFFIFFYNERLSHYRQTFQSMMLKFDLDVCKKMFEHWILPPLRYKILKSGLINLILMKFFYEIYQYEC